MTLTLTSLTGQFFIYVFFSTDNAKVNKELAMNKLKKQAKNMSKNITILDDVRSP